ncbi:DASS family sodium-coupled anion symporter [Bryobacter aggregatus]|uniref:DASS family sodium-coupled anion symporter n=1 Tax=Bryobacter aggregatus TaxID=360054 RepID=UPI0006918C14|nr:DASS family sodium-coupled anion symporter [Bryobacter aggregatus]
MGRIPKRIWGLALLVAIYLLIAYGFPKPDVIKPEGWRLFSLFVATVAGLIFQPVSGGALVLMAVVFASIVGGLSIKQALDGYSDPTNWLVLAAFFISRALIKSGLARRIALFFVRLFGKTSLGVSYALCFSDIALASIIPSNGARSGGVILPIVRSVAELYGSKPGLTSNVIGAFLMTSVYQGVCISSAMFLTGQASNPLAAQLAGKLHNVQIDWFGWFRAGVVPGLCSILAVPWLVSKIYPPEVKNTPEAAAFAHQELSAMGKLGSNEWVLTAVFLGVCGAWATTSIHKMDVAVPALLGSIALLITGVLTWEDVKKEEAAWDMFIWYGGLLNLAKALNSTGIPTEFAKFVGGSLEGLNWYPLMMIALLVYFFAHYAFASITAHLLAMFPAFVGVIIGQGAPAGLACFGFAMFANLSAGLTNYGTTPAPMFFAQEYVDMKSWWRVGFLCALLNIAIWSTVGFAWWKFVGLW